MKKHLLLLIVFCISFTTVMQAQDKKENKFKVGISGFVKSDFFFDSRQTISAREGHFLLYPKPVSEDADGKDINSHSSFNFLSIQSRFALKLSGPDFLNAKTSGKIEGDFFAQKADNINLFRLRHAYLKLNWENTEVLFGQYWIPMFVTGCFPGTVSFNTGTPMQPFGRSPQIRVTHNYNGVKLIGVLSSQRDYATVGPNGASGEYLRNSGMPAMDFQIHYSRVNKDKGTALFVGVGHSIKTIVPQLVTSQGYKTDASLSSAANIAFLKMKIPDITLKFEAVYGQQMDHNLSLGGYAIKDSTDLVRGIVNYLPSNTLSLWTDIHTNGKKWQVGVFAGITQNMGYDEDIETSSIKGRGTNIESLFRVSPRLVYNMGKVRFALEAEYTAANFGTDYDSKGLPINIVKADNLRVLFAAYYFF